MRKTRTRLPGPTPNVKNGSAGGAVIFQERALVLHPYEKANGTGRSVEACLEEAVGLTQAINLDVVCADTVRLQRARPGTLFGPGVVDTYRSIIAEENIAVAVAQPLDHEPPHRIGIVMGKVHRRHRRYIILVADDHRNAVLVFCRARRRMGQEYGHRNRCETPTRA